jgi:hypothetical protein
MGVKLKKQLKVDGLVWRVPVIPTTLKSIVDEKSSD